HRAGPRRRRGCGRRGRAAVRAVRPPGRRPELTGPGGFHDRGSYPGVVTGNQPRSLSFSDGETLLFICETADAAPRAVLRGAVLRGCSDVSTTRSSRWTISRS